MQTDIIGVTIGVAGIVIGLFASYFFYRKSIKAKEPCWAIRSNNLIKGFGSKYENLRVLFEEQEIEDLTVSKIIFWNDGVETITREDIKTINHLRIVCSQDIKILDAKVIASNNLSSQFTVEHIDNENYVNLEFGYLDKSQGAVLQVIHTGTTSKDLQIVGDIKAVKSFNKMPNSSVLRIIFVSREKINNWNRKHLKSHRKTVSYISICLGILYVFLGVTETLEWINTYSSFSELIPRDAKIFNSWLLLFTFYVGGFILVIMGLALLKFTFPKGLEIYFQE